MPETTLYYKFLDGSVAEQTFQASGVIVDPEPPPGAVPITAAVYATLKAALDQATEVLVATLQQAEQAVKGEDYAALIAAGIPAATARRLTGYQDDGDGDGGPILHGLPAAPGGAS